MYLSSAVLLFLLAFGVSAKQQSRSAHGGHARRQLDNDTSIPYVPWESWLAPSTSSTIINATISAEPRLSAASTSETASTVTSSGMPTSILTSVTSMTVSGLNATSPSPTISDTSPTPSADPSTESSIQSDSTVAAASTTSDSTDDPNFLGPTSASDMLDTTTPLPWAIWGTASGAIDTFSISASSTNVPFPNSTTDGANQTATASSITPTANGTIILTSTRMITITATTSTASAISASATNATISTNITDLSTIIGPSDTSVTIGATISSIPLWLNSTTSISCTLSDNTTTSYVTTITGTPAASPSNNTMISFVTTLSPTAASSYTNTTMQVNTTATASYTNATMQVNATTTVTGTNTTPMNNATLPPSSVFWPNITGPTWASTANASNTDYVPAITTTLPFESTTIILTIPLSFMSGLGPASSLKSSTANSTLSATSSLGQPALANVTATAPTMGPVNNTGSPTMITLTNGLTTPLTITATTIQPNATTVTASLVTSTCVTAIVSFSDGSALATPSSVLDCAYRACVGSSCFIRETLKPLAVEFSPSVTVAGTSIPDNTNTTAATISTQVTASAQLSSQEPSLITTIDSLGSDIIIGLTWTTAFTTLPVSYDSLPTLTTTVNVCIDDLTLETVSCNPDQSSPVTSTASQPSSSYTWISMNSSLVEATTTLNSSSSTPSTSFSSVTSLLPIPISALSAANATTSSPSNTTATISTTPITVDDTSTSSPSSTSNPNLNNNTTSTLTTLSTSVISSSQLSPTIWTPYGSPPIIPPVPGPGMDMDRNRDIPRTPSPARKNNNQEKGKAHNDE